MYIHLIFMARRLYVVSQLHKECCFVAGDHTITFFDGYVNPCPTTHEGADLYCSLGPLIFVAGL